MNFMRQVLRRFGEFRTFGMSRIISFNVLGRHFPGSGFGAAVDFQAENAAETQIVERLHAEGVLIGVYAFGRSAAHDEASALNHRAMKGPAVVTAGTLRPLSGPFARPEIPTLHQMPEWSPQPYLTLRKPLAPNDSPDRLPDWAQTYPIAQAAMRMFDEGQNAHEAQIGDWRLSARAVRVSQDDCIQCHTVGIARPAGAKTEPLHLGDALGGILYVYRR